MKKLYGRDIWDEFVFNKMNVDHQGWNGKHDLLRRLALSGSNPTVVDVGVWKGESTLTIASAMRDAKVDGCVFSIDTFLGSTEHWSAEGDLFKRRVGMPNLYETFLANVWSLDLAPYVIPMPQLSSAAAKILGRLGEHVSAVHIDASHDYEDVMADSLRYWSLLRDGGVLIGDDYDDGWPDVIRASQEFSKLVKRPLSIDKPKWFIQK